MARPTFEQQIARDVQRYERLLAAARRRPGITIRQARELDDARRRVGLWALIAKLAKKD